MRPSLLAVLLGAVQAAAAMPVLDLASAAELARACACVAVGLDPDGTMLYQATSDAAGLDGVLAKHRLARNAAGQIVIAA